MSQTRPRVRSDRNRLIGKELLRFLDSFEIESDGLIPVTAARKFIHANSLRIPCLICVNKTSISSDRFVWVEGGTFGALYAEFNWLLFPSLKKIYKDNMYDKVFDHIDRLDLTAEVQKIKTEFTFI